MIHILVVDDQKTIREGLKAILESEPDLVVVGTAKDGQSGIEQVALLQPDVVLIDMEMPGIDGVKTTEIICQNYIGTKIIVLSCSDSDEYVSKSLRAGAMGYLLKNTPASELKEAIRSVYRGYAQIGPGLLGKVLSQVPKSNSNLSQINISQPSELQKQLLSTSSEIDIEDLGIRASKLQPLKNKSSYPSNRSWQSYLAIWLIGNTLLWTAALAYLKFKAPTYKSEWAIGLPTGKNSTNVNLPEIGNAYSQSDSPFSNSQVSDPRENYKFLVETKEVREAAASHLNIPVKKLGKPRIKIVDNTTLMEFAIDGKTPQEAYEKALAFQNALDARLNQLREQEMGQQDWQLQATLDSSKRQLQEAHKRLSEYKARAPVSSREQLQNLSTNIEDLRRQKAETLAQLQQITASSKELSINLGLSVQEAADAFVLQSDPLFQQYSTDYSRINAELVNLESKFSPANPAVIAKQAEKDEAQTALLRRGQTLLKKPFSQALLEQLSLNNDNSFNSNRASLLQELVSLQTQQKGLQNQAQELERQIKNLENRLSSLSPQESTLANLNRDVQIAEAVFSSTMTKLDLSKSDIFASYPRIQMVTEPNIPDEPSSPKTKFVLLGSSMSSFFLGTGLFSLWWRDRRNQQAKKEEKQIELNLLPSFNPTNNSNSVFNKK
ncbi:response regulator [Pleurocapsales cyanobacterium LEGE 06147]|nr:response regulator [Pleurocapsales cyanobacterium LEGE 06147]